MKNIALAMLLSFLVFLSVFCNDSDSIVIGNQGGTFQGKIVLLDSLGANHISGIININQINSIDLNGSWSFQNRENGKLVGSINDMKVQINLNPNFIDNNTILFGSFDGKTIKGEWFHSGVGGVDNRGTFLATAF